MDQHCLELTLSRLDSILTGFQPVSVTVPASDNLSQDRASGIASGSSTPPAPAERFTQVDLIRHEVMCKPRIGFTKSCRRQTVRLCLDLKLFDSMGKAIVTIAFLLKTAQSLICKRAIHDIMPDNSAAGNARSEEVEL